MVMPNTHRSLRRCSALSRLRLSSFFITTTLLTGVLSHRAAAQGFTGFTSGNLVVSRSVYTGTSGSVAFPGTLPNGAASVADGSYPSIFNNETPDPAFGITSPIFLDELTTSGSLITSLNVTNAVSAQLGANLATSFPSKSELGLNLTPDGTGLTFMAYGAAANQLDISNSNTPGHIDFSNPVNALALLTAQRDIAQVNYQGTVQLTTTNTYSGNNGRNVVLGSNGNYYMVGNAGNNGKSATIAAGTVSISNLSNTVTFSGASSAANMYVGMPFSGTNIPTGTYVTAINSPTSVTLSAQATGSASGAYTANEAALQLTGLSFAANNATVTINDTSKLAVGSIVTGTNVPAGAYVASITDGQHFTLNTAPTVASAGSNYTAGIPNSMLSDNTGVQMIAQGSNDTTTVTNSTVVGKVNGTYGTSNGYQRGFTVTQVGAAVDKTGKDDNFRGITNYNNAIYVTKGSGGNGFDGVYQVNPNGGGYVAPGSSAGLATSGNAGTASINALPGWPTTSTGANESKTLTTPIVYHPFGIWFANDTTLYVGDEGAVGVTNAAAGGLEKWTWNSGTQQWVLNYTLQAGLIGASYTVTDPNNGANTVTPTAGGLRNIDGQVNSDGTVTIYGITSTYGSALVDAGADPNQLVGITDTLGDTTLTQAGGESFAVLETAAYGQVLRGVSLSPTPEPGSAVLILSVGGMVLGTVRRRQTN